MREVEVGIEKVKQPNASCRRDSWTSFRIGKEKKETQREWFCTKVRQRESEIVCKRERERERDVGKIEQE